MGLAAYGQAETRERLSASAFGWSFLETGRTCYIVLVSIYVFVPYLAADLAGSPVEGQKLVADFNLWAGIGAALIAPLLGTTIDHLGRRKPLLILLFVAAVPAASLLWFAGPGGLPILAVGMMLALATLLFSLCEVVQNSLLVHAAQPVERGHASGIAYAFGHGASVLAMLIVLWAFVLPGSSSFAWLPDRPLLGLDPALHEPERIVGPLCAVFILLSLIPLMLFTRDAPTSALPVRAAVRAGFADLRGMVGLLRREREARRFLFARMVFADALGGIVVFTGVFAAGVFGWGASELVIEGLVASVFAAGGGILVGHLDAWLGVKRSLLVSLTGFLVCVIGEIGVARDRIFFVFAYDPLVHGRPWSLPLFDTWPEWVFIGCDLGVSVFLTCAFASSRTMMAALAPPDRSASFFGLFAFSGRATAWLCPLLVGIATAATGSQQIGFVPIALLTVVGMALLWSIEVRPPRLASDRHADGRGGSPLEAPARAAIGQL